MKVPQPNLHGNSQNRLHVSPKMGIAQLIFMDFINWVQIYLLRVVIRRYSIAVEEDSFCIANLLSPFQGCTQFLLFVFYINISLSGLKPRRNDINMKTILMMLLIRKKKNNYRMIVTVPFISACPLLKFTRYTYTPDGCTTPSVFPSQSTIVAVD